METDSSNMGVGKIDLDRGARRPRHISEKRLAANRRSAQKSTGPRTIRGKQRSRHNALKSGIFANAILLNGEDSVAYDSLRKGLMEDWKPVGTFEATLVETLASLIWRRRRLLRAERAEISKVVEFDELDSSMAQSSECWDLLRAPGNSSGILRNSSNPFVIKEAIDTLKICRDCLEKFGFDGKDPWRLRTLYGVDSEGFTPPGLFRTYQVYSKLATDPQKKSEANASPDELKKEMLEIFAQEIERLTELRTALEVLDSRRKEYEALAALVPSVEISERYIRREAHLSREIDRTLSQLERARRIRLCKTEPPGAAVGINGL